MSKKYLSFPNFTADVNLLKKKKRNLPVYLTCILFRYVISNIRFFVKSLPSSYCLEKKSSNQQNTFDWQRANWLPR